jgi:hypothetical protein
MQATNSSNKLPCEQTALRWEELDEDISVSGTSRVASSFPSRWQRRETVPISAFGEAKNIL